MNRRNGLLLWTVAALMGGGGCEPAGGGPAADLGPGGPGPSSPQERCAVIARSIEAAGFSERVSVRCEAQVARIVSSTDPAHPMMNGITGTNDQVPVPAPGYSSPVVLQPARAAKLTTIDAALGIAVNGVPIYDYTSQGDNDPNVYDPRADTKLTGELDLCNGHSGRGDDYHYHAAPVCMIEAMKNKGPAAIIGWAFDGYPIYGDANPDGSAIAAGALDVCNAQPDGTFGYRYHTSQKPPYVLQCLVGQFDLALAPRVPPLSKQGGGGKPAGRKPPGGVTDLKLVQDADGTRRMTYSYQGQAYSIQYKPSAAADCWDFQERSYSTGGAMQSATYCRAAR